MYQSDLSYICQIHLYPGATTQPQIFSIGATRLSSGQPQIQISGLDPAKRYGIQLLGYSRGGDGPPTKRLDFVFGRDRLITPLICAYPIIIITRFSAAFQGNTTTINKIIGSVTQRSFSGNR